MAEFNTGIEFEYQDAPQITRDRLFGYAEASGDPNKIHLDDAEAKAVGLPGVIAHGMLIAAFVADRSLSYVRGKSIFKWRITRFVTRFKSMTFPGDTISCGGLVKKSADKEITLEMKARNQNGVIVLMGLVTLEME